MHRDIKPENLLLDKDGRIKIADFGIARMLRGSHARQSVGDVDHGSAHALASEATETDLTQESVLGTPSYMAPEQREHPASVDHRADIFSLGVVLYEMLTGELPGATLQPPSRKVQIDVRLDEIVLRALEQQPELRFQTAAEFRRQVTTVAKGEPASERKKPTIRLPMIASGIATTPEKLATFLGQFFAPRNRGEFVLDENQLSIRRWPTLFRSGETTLIPLKSIRDVEVDRYSAMVSFGALDFVCVTYQSDGQTRQQCFTPLPGTWTSIAAMNQYVAEWSEAIRSMTDGRELRQSRAVQPAMPHSGSQRGFLFLGLGIFAVLAFLFGGGVVTSSNGGPSTAIFFAAFVVGLLFPGVLVYRSIVASACNIASPPPMSAKKRLLIQWLGPFLTLISIPAWQAFFRSEAFVSSSVQNAFLILMGIGLAQFFPLGLGFIRRERWPRGEDQSPLGPITDERSQRRKIGATAAVERWLLMGVSLIVVVAFVVMNLVEKTVATADVLVQQAVVDQGHFSFHYTAKCPPGWNAWLVIENYRPFRTDSSKVGDPAPTLVSHSQLKLANRGRVSVPLEYLPTSEPGRRNMLASLPDADQTPFYVTANRNINLLAYTTEEPMHVEASLWILPEKQSPNSEAIKYGNPGHQTIEPPVMPPLGPFEGAFVEGKVELVQLGQHPRNGSPYWKPDGNISQEANVPESNGSSSSSQHVIKEIVFRVHSDTGLASSPVLRFPEKSGPTQPPTPTPTFSAMGSSYHRPDDKQPYATLIHTIACPPDARQMTIEIGVADGDWRSSLTFERHENQLQHGASSSGRNGTWQGSVRTTRVTGETIPLAYSFSRRDDYETRLVYERADGTIVPLQGDGSDGSHELMNAITTLPVKEFESIRRFHVQSRLYQWIEFRNVSLELGHRTNVEVR